MSCSLLNIYLVMQCCRTTKVILAIVLNLLLDHHPVCLFEYEDETVGFARLFGHGFTWVSRGPGIVERILQVCFEYGNCLSEATGTASLYEIKWCHHPGRQQIHCLHRCLDEESGACLTQVMCEHCGCRTPFNQKDCNSYVQFTYTKCSCLGYETAATEVAKYVVQGPEPRLSFPRYVNQCGDCTLYCADPSRPSPVKEEILVRVSFKIHGGSSTMFLH